MTRPTDDYAAGFADAIEKAVVTAGEAIRVGADNCDKSVFGDNLAEFVEGKIRALTPDPLPERQGRQVTEEMVEAALQVVADYGCCSLDVVRHHDGEMVRDILEAALAVSHDQKGGR